MYASTIFSTEPTAPFGDDKGTEIFLFIFFVDSVLSVVNHPLAHPIRYSKFGLAVLRAAKSVYNGRPLRMSREDRQFLLASLLEHQLEEE